MKCESVAQSRMVPVRCGLVRRIPLRDGAAGRARDDRAAAKGRAHDPATPWRNRFSPRSRSASSHGSREGGTGHPYPSRNRRPARGGSQLRKLRSNARGRRATRASHGIPRSRDQHVPGHRYDLGPGSGRADAPVASRRAASSGLPRSADCLDDPVRFPYSVRRDQPRRSGRSIPVVAGPRNHL
jgi:hypothetical protein